MNEDQADGMIDVLNRIATALEKSEIKANKSSRSFNFLQKRNDLLIMEIYPNLSEEDKEKVNNIKLKDCY